MQTDANFWENMTYLLGGIVLAGIMAAAAQIIHLRMLVSGQTKFRICVKKEGHDGDGKQVSADH